jgi:Zn finger protein HypA/HybF involved in hydrogenase expression
VLAITHEEGTICAWRPPAEAASGRRASKGKEVDMAQYEAYCVKCREKREFEGEEVTLKNGRKAAQGKCPVCGTKVMRILGKSA